MTESIDRLITAHENRVDELARMIQEEVSALRQLRALRNQPELPLGPDGDGQNGDGE